MKKIYLGLILLLSLAPSGCFSDPGSKIDISLDGNTCVVSMSPRGQNFNIIIELECDQNGQNCYQITALSCQGEKMSSHVPIDMTQLDGCPGKEYCISDCTAGLEAPGFLWDIPSLKAIDRCNVYIK